MKTVQTKIKKIIKCHVVASNGVIKIKFPKQTIQSLAVMFDKSDGSQVILKQWELVLKGDRLEVVTIK